VSGVGGIGEAVSSLPRIAVLSAELADQIAAGEVVERPAAVVKELIENAVDAGATRIDVELEGAGLRAIRVVDDGQGIHPDDLPLALRRHATSKIKRAEELLEIRTHGFRGEALASIAAVARVRLRSRTADAAIGHQVQAGPDRDPESSPVGMPTGTQVDVEHLFASVPARRKFMRAEATEVGHCSEALLRVALVHPEVSFRLAHEGRVLVDLAPTDLRGRVAAVLARRGADALFEVAGEVDGVAVRGFLAGPERSSRARSGVSIVVRGRVVHERNLVQLLRQAYGERLAHGSQPVACLFVEPPPGTVDVNVHPQKIEVRFAAAQTVFAATRAVLERALVEAPWGGAAATERTPGERAREAAPVWSAAPPPPAPRGGVYRLGTRAAEPDYFREKQALRREAESLGERLRAAREPTPSAPVPEAGPELLTCLPGPVGVFRDGDALLVVDLARLRAHLVYRRLVDGPSGARVAAQLLLSPVVVQLNPADVEACGQAEEELLAIGIDLEPFGPDSVLVRAVPAGLRECVDDADIADLLARVLPWVRLRRGAPTPDERDELLTAIAHTRAADPAPRLARRWVRELHEAGELGSTPGVRWISVAGLLGPT
jgi:DNA mismatch repair protein MutL